MLQLKKKEDVWRGQAGAAGISKGKAFLEKTLNLFGRVQL